MSNESRLLLGHASDLLDRADPATAGFWPRAASTLARQSIESSMNELWALRAPSLQRCSTRAQLLCLPEYLRDGDIAASAAHAWAALSRVCHHHPYELPPTAVELEHWLDIAERLAEAVERHQEGT